MLRVGLTGGIACGKSLVLRALAREGCHTIDLDAVSRQVTGPGSPALTEIARVFGRSVIDIDGGLDRAALAGRVFGNPNEREALNAIVHPRVREVEAAWAASLAHEPDAVLVTDGALLIETGAHLRFDRLVVVHCDPAQQIGRLLGRTGLSAGAARARIDAQLPADEKRPFAHFEVDNSGSMQDTEVRAHQLAEELVSQGREPRPLGGHPIDALLPPLLHGYDRGPRGLTPDSLLESAAAVGGIDLASLARRLQPPAKGPWYRSAGEAAPDAPALALSVALAAWGLRRGEDSLFVASAAGSLARLTHLDAEARSDACLLALVVLDAASTGIGTSQVSRAARLRPLAIRWGGTKVSQRLWTSLEAADRHGADPVAAGREADRMGGDGTVAASLAALGTPAEDSPRSSRLRRTLQVISPRS